MQSVAELDVSCRPLDLWQLKLLLAFYERLSADSSPKRLLSKELLVGLQSRVEAHLATWLPGEWIHFSDVLSELNVCWNSIVTTLNAGVNHFTYDRLTVHERLLPNNVIFFVTWFDIWFFFPDCGAVLSRYFSGERTLNADPVTAQKLSAFLTWYGVPHPKALAQMGLTGQLPLSGAPICVRPTTSLCMFGEHFLICSRSLRILTPLWIDRTAQITVLFEPYELLHSFAQPWKTDNLLENSK